MAAAGRFGSSSDIDIGTILADKDCKRTNNSNQANNMMMPQQREKGIISFHVQKILLLFSN
jgi:hypothetical protein